MLELSGPVVVTLELNPPGPGRLKTGDPECETLKIAQWEKIIQKLDVYVQEYRIAGGEPTEHQDFFKILGALEKTGKFYHLFTTGIWADTDAILEGFTNCAHINTVTFGLHGASFDAHSALSPNVTEDDFEKLLDNIRLTYAAGYNVNTNTILTKENFEQIEEIAELSTDLGANYAIFSRCINPPSEELSLDPAELKKAGEAVEELKSLGYNVMMGNCIPYCFLPSPTAGCFAGVTLAAVDSCGNVKPCSDSGMKAGNLLEEDVSRIWRSKTMREWRKKIPSDCKNCSKLSVCPGGCKVMSEVLEVDKDPLISEAIKKPDHPPVLDVTLEEDLCPLARYIMRREDFGWILIKGNQVIPVKHRAEKILKALDGTVTLGEIQKKFGAGALSFIYSLYVRDFVEFRAKVEEEEKV